MCQELYIDYLIYSSWHETKKLRLVEIMELAQGHTASKRPIGLRHLASFFHAAHMTSQCWAGSVPSITGSTGPWTITITAEVSALLPEITLQVISEWQWETWTYSRSSENQTQDENLWAGRDPDKNTAILEFYRWEHWDQGIRIRGSAQVNNYLVKLAPELLLLPRIKTRNSAHWSRATGK